MPRHSGAHFNRSVPQNTQSLASWNATLGEKKIVRRVDHWYKPVQKSGSSEISHAGNTEHLVLPSWLFWLIFTSAKCPSGSSGLLPALAARLRATAVLELWTHSQHWSKGTTFPWQGKEQSLVEAVKKKKIPFPREQQRGEEAHSSSSQSESCILCELLTSQTLIVLLLFYCSSSEFLWKGLLWSRKAWSSCTSESNPWLREEQQLQETFLTHHWIFQWVVFWQQHVLKHWRAPLQKHVDFFFKARKKSKHLL